MADVTVLGAGGATVTISLSSTQNAINAQTAVNFVNNLTGLGIVDQRTWSGSGTLPAPTKVLAGAIVSTPGDVGGLWAQSISLAVNAPGDSTVIGSQNSNITVVSGDGSNLTFGNQAQDGTVFFGDSDSRLVNFAGKADLTVGKGAYILQTQEGASTRVQPVVNATIVTSDFGGKSGANVIDVNGKATVFAAGSSTVAATINATAGELLFVNLNKGSAFIQGGTANVTVVGNATDMGGRATVFGGGGRITVSNGQGEFRGGTAGGNVMFTSTVAGSATLIGGGNGDQLYSMGSGNLLIAGAGNSTLSGRNAGAGANTFFTGSGETTVFGAGQGGNTYLFSGLGVAQVDGRDETAMGKASQNTYINSDTDGNASIGSSVFIGDFLTGVDKLLLGLSEKAAITYFAPDAISSPFGATGGTQVLVSSGAQFFFYDKVGSLGQDIFQNDIINTKV